ncbi:hypothetical protein DSECCO2_375820 [anaerobic digester metagenome]
MTLKTQSRALFSAQFGYRDNEGNPSERAIANLLRAPLNRWGLSPRRDILKYARDQLRVGGIEDVSKVSHVLQRLIDLGECDEMFIGQQPYLAPTSPRWIAVGDNVITYLGVYDPPEGLPLINYGHGDIVRRLNITADEDITTLELAGVQETSLREWFFPPTYLCHASRRMRKPVRGDAISLSDFWDLLENKLNDEGLMFGTDTEIRILAGHPGGFFGKYNSAQPEGRWSANPTEGIWCGYRNGYGDAHGHPCIVSVDNNKIRVLDLYDIDEWFWAVLARGHRFNNKEIVKIDGEKIQFTFHAPRQLRAAMDILGTPSGAWSWRASSGYQNFREFFSEIVELDVNWSTLKM